MIEEPNPKRANTFFENFSTKETSLNLETGESGRETRCLKCINLEQRLKNKEQIYEELTRLNMDLQNTVIKTHEDIVKKLFGAGTTAPAGQSQNVGVGEVVGNKVHVGQGVFIEKDIYNWCYTHSKNGSVFVKEMAVAVFGHETLAQSSVTGKACNRTKSGPKPALNSTKMRAVLDIYQHYLTAKGTKADEIAAELKKTKSYISSKIADMNREPRKNKVVQIKQECSDVVSSHSATPDMLDNYFDGTRDEYLYKENEDVEDIQ